MVIANSSQSGAFKYIDVSEVNFFHFKSTDLTLIHNMNELTGIKFQDCTMLVTILGIFKEDYIVTVSQKPKIYRRNNCWHKISSKT